MAQVPGAPGDEEELEEPTCVFSGMIWEGLSINGLGYFIEGKPDGEFVEVFLPNGGRSRKYAYYGDPPLVFYREVEVEEEKDKAKPGDRPAPRKDDDSKEPPPPKIVYVPVTSASFELAWKEIFLFFFKAKQEVDEYQVNAISFSHETFPAGHYWFFSRCEHPLTLQFGLDRGQLPAGGQAMIKARRDEFGDLGIRVFEQKGRAPRKVYSTIWNYNARTRTLVFMLPTSNGVKVRRIVDVVQEEKALGLRPPKEDEKKEKTPPSGPGN